MSRRPLTPAPNATAKAANRMAPGGRLWSETPIRPLYRPVGEAGPGGGTVLPTGFYWGWTGELWRTGPVLEVFSTYYPDAGDMVLGVLIAAGGATTAELTAPAGWTVLGSGTSGNAAVLVAGVDSWAAHGSEWGLSGMNDDAWTDCVGFAWQIKGASGMSWNPATLTHTPGSSGSWSGADTGAAIRFQFVMTVGWVGRGYDYSGIINDRATNSARVYWYPAPNDNSETALFSTSAAWTESFTDIEEESSPYGQHIWAIGVGAS